MSVDCAEAFARGEPPLGDEDCKGAETELGGEATRTTSTAGADGGSGAFTVGSSDGARSGTPRAEAALLGAAEVVTL